MGLRSLISAFVLFAAGCGGNTDPKMDCAAWSASTDSSNARDWPPVRAGYVNPIVAENLLPGDPDWHGGRLAAQELEAYADHVSAKAGDPIAVKVRSARPRTMHWSLYRVGWYGGAGARRVLDGEDVPVTEQPACPRDANTGMVKCDWSTAFELEVGADWVSGLYAVRLDADDMTQLLPLVITDDRPADLLAQFAMTTWEAYNAWGGESLYADASGTLPDGRAVQVSFDRPYQWELSTTLFDRDGQFVRFAEHWGYDVSYSTNIDVAAGGWENLFRRGAFVSVGHDEYWPRAERNAVQAARDLGVPLLFFGANDAYYKIRFDTPADENPRSFTCYKGGTDPMSGPDHTGQYRIQGRPESGIIGEMYESWMYRTFPWVVANEHHFLFEGTGLHEGDALPLLVGDEYDRTFSECVPGNLRVAARSPVVDSAGRPGVAETVTYRAASGALVFAAGTIDWALGLGAPGVYDPRIERITANVFKAAVGVKVPAGLGGDPLPEPAALTYVDPALGVGTEASGLTGVTSVAALADGTMVVSEPDLDRLVSVGPAPDRQLTIVASDKSVFDGKTEASVRGLRQPTAVVADAHGNLFVADTGNQCIRKIAADARHTMTTLAGAPGVPGFVDGTPDKARFSTPLGLAIDSQHNTLFVADSGNNRIRAIDLTVGPTLGRTRTVAGSARGYGDGPGATATFHAPTALAFAPDGRLFVVCSGQIGRIAMIASDVAHTVTTLVPGGDGATDGEGSQAKLGPQGGAVWHDGLLIVSDPANYLLRAIAPGTDAASTQVATLAGSRRFGHDDADAADASFGLPLGLAVAADGSLLVADGYNGSIRAIH